MLPLRERIFPNVDIDIDSNNMRICTVCRKKHANGKYYLIQITRNAQVWEETEKPLAIRAMINDFNRIVFISLVFTPVDLERRNSIGAPIFVEDPDQRDEADRVANIFYDYEKTL